MKLLDTSVLVDIDRGGVDERVGKLDEQGRHAISIVSVTELHRGVNKRYGDDVERHTEATEDLERLLSRFEVLPLTRPIAITMAEAGADIGITARDDGEGVGKPYGKSRQ